MNNQRKAYIYAVIAILFWSTVSTAFKIGLKYLDFIQLLFYSTLTATCILFVILGFQRKLKLLIGFSLKQYLVSAFLGFLNPFLYYMVLLKAYSILPAQIAQPLNYTWPVMLVILSIPLLKQKLTAISFIAILISFAGVFVISAQGNLLNYDFSQPFGVLLATGSSVIWAFFWIFNVRDKRDEVIKLFLNFLFSLIYIAIAVYGFSSFRINNVNALLSTTYLGFFEMGITFVLWMKAMQLTTSSAKISNLVFISPFIALILIHFILGEKIYGTTVLGLILIIIGIGVQQFSAKFKK